jgi:apolipoprotein N-acyltransferase
VEPKSTSGIQVERENHQPGAPPVFTAAAISLALLWFSFPPVGLAVVAWIAPMPLIWLVLPASLSAKSPSGRRAKPYWKLYFAGLLYWLATFYFIPIPHPALWLGWIAVSAYMAAYTPLTIGVSRVLVHRFGWPAVIAVPITWTGIEWIRCWFATGMGMVCLSHSQAKIPIAIQIADLSGGYTVTFVMIVFAAGMMTTWHRWQNSSAANNSSYSRILSPGIFAALVLAASLGYGYWQLMPLPDNGPSPMLKVALVQTSEDVVFAPMTQDQIENRIQRVVALTNEAAAQEPNLICWPESGLMPCQWLLSDASAEYSAEDSEKEIRMFWSEAVGRNSLQGTPLLTGVLANDVQQQEIFNAAVLIDRHGNLAERYDKVHPVMFGEYIPFGKWFPVLERLAPTRSIEFGQTFKAFTVDEFVVAPSICFETTIPHLIRRQVNTLAAANLEPDVLINLTNDGWFFGTSCLDLHLACNVFRAVEMRKPHLVCANTGFSASIDSSGRIQQVGPRRSEAVIVASIHTESRASLYRKIGDILPGLCGGIVFFVAFAGWRQRKTNAAVR